MDSSFLINIGRIIGNPDIRVDELIKIYPSLTVIIGLIITNRQDEARQLIDQSNPQYCHNMATAIREKGNLIKGSVDKNFVILSCAVLFDNRGIIKDI